MAVSCHHTATHLLHAALREILGTHVEQRGSDMSDTGLRFDFSHPKALQEGEIRAVEDLVNEKIRADIPREIEEMSLAEAKKRGARALFGEKYPEKVRVITFDPKFFRRALWRHPCAAHRRIGAVSHHQRRSRFSRRAQDTCGGG